MTAGPKPLTLFSATEPVLLIVSDGVGGANAGEVASRVAVQTISSAFGGGPAEEPGETAPRDPVLDAINAADRAIKAKAAEAGLEGMGATVSLLCFSCSEHALWGQAGDSRIYVCRAGRLRQISRDHSPVGRMRQSGEITEAEARRHPLRNQIDQSLGNPEEPFQPESGSVDVMAGDVFLLCSDGLVDGLWDHEIEALLAGVRSPEDVRPAVLRLVESANKASGRDNITAIVALVVDSAPGGDGPPSRTFWRRLFQRRSALA
jgi:protein phosphatase